MEYQKEFVAEQQYLDRTLGFIRENLAREEAACSDEKEQIVSARKEMWENVSFRGGFDNAVDFIRQYKILPSSRISAQQNTALI